MGYVCMQVGIRARAALVRCVTQKAFRLSTVRQDESAKIVNFVASDIQKVYDAALVRGGEAPTPEDLLRLGPAACATYALVSPAGMLTPAPAFTRAPFDPDLLPRRSSTTCGPPRWRPPPSWACSAT
jgi:hypothetical protein